jgi:hypothetical protein
MDKVKGFIFPSSAAPGAQAGSAVSLVSPFSLVRLESLVSSVRQVILVSLVSRS